MTINDKSLVSLITTYALLAASSSVLAAQPASAGPKLGLSFTELQPSVKMLRFAFECQDGLEIEARWIAQNVGKSAPPNYVIGTYTMVTRGPLNITTLSRPTNGWPLGLYRLELVHNGTVFHVEHYVIDDAQTE